MTKIQKCEGCKSHPYQDKRYGRNVRVHNEKAGGASAVGSGWVCTVCGKKN